MMTSMNLSVDLAERKTGRLDGDDGFKKLPNPKLLTLSSPYDDNQSGLVCEPDWFQDGRMGDGGGLLHLLNPAPITLGLPS